MAAVDRPPMPLPITIQSKLVGTFLIENPSFTGLSDVSMFGHFGLRRYRYIAKVMTLVVTVITVTDVVECSLAIVYFLYEH